MDNTTRPIEILLVEDNEGDVFLTKNAFREGCISNTIHVARDGEQALSMLLQESPYENQPTPDLILLDINLPKIDGREVLDKIKHVPKLRRIPVIVLTSSSEHRDILDMYDLHASSYITKPVDIEQFRNVVHAIEGFWFSIVVLPTT